MDKYKMLEKDLKKAHEEAVKIKSENEGDAANLESTFLILKGWKEDKVLEAVKGAGLCCSRKTDWVGAGYIIKFSCGQANRIKARKRFKKFLEKKGYTALEYGHLD